MLLSNNYNDNWDYRNNVNREALHYLERAVRLIPGDVITGTQKIVAEIQTLPAHFLRQPDTPIGVKQRLQRLVR